ncbi:ATP-binding protein [Telmatospirillum sp.]|uniref:ATP-binding protein n=1 Tax=Telmatospirillum sp. TaxID=2079197 RepID=UPI00284C2FFE|nr:ATP-binding protein [Telmatospirillum sp.]MDR3439772.1 ATP-binding protein [Telmatospirillum sp.]
MSIDRRSIETVPRPGDGHKPRLPLEVLVILLMASVTLLVLGLIGWHLITNRNDVLNRAEKSAANLASAFEEHLTVSIGLLNDTLLAARSQDFVKDSDRLREGLRVRPGLNDIALQVSVADRTGQMIASNFDLGGPVSIADREHFRHFADSDLDDLFISKPVLGRVSQQWTIQFVRRRITPAGQFDGAIVISLAPEYLIRFYHTIDVGPSGLVTVVGLDGVIRAQTTKEHSSFGQALGDAPLLRAAIANRIGFVRSSGSADGVARLVAFKRVGNYPLFVAVGLAEEDVLADFRREMWVWLAMAAAGVLFLSLAGTLALRQIRAQRVYENRIADHQRELERQVAQRTHRLSAEIDKRAQSEQALRESIEAMKKAQSEALQASRMASVGQLAAGIAHEINTPIQYIGDNLRFIGESLDELMDPVENDQKQTTASGSDASSAVRKKTPAEKLKFLRDELPTAVSESLDGVGQISRIVLSMKEFSHPGTTSKTITDINRSLESTLTVSHNLWKHVANVEQRFDPSLPQILCHAGEMNQVFLNLIVNAAHSIETSGKPLPGSIVIETGHDAGFVSIRVSDNGTGVPQAIRSRIFDLFFTTKEVGKGTGQGLAICRDVVVDKHGGTISVDGEEGVGAIFTIRLPIAEIDGNEETQ